MHSRCHQVSPRQPPNLGRFLRPLNARPRIRSTSAVDIDVREDGPTVRYIAEMPVKDKTTEEWLKGNAAYLASTKLAGEA